MSGGTFYDRHIAAALRADGWHVTLDEVPGRFPLRDGATADAADALLAELRDGETVVFDGLALPAFERALEGNAARLRPFALIHHPTADETGLSPDESARLFGIERGLFAAMRGLIVPSPAMVRRLGDFGVAAQRVCVVEPGVERAARSTGSGGHEALLLCVASLTPRKGHDLLLAALGDCADLAWRLVCAGPTDADPPTTAAVEDLADRLGLSSRVSFVGPQRGGDLEALYASADVFVLTSRYEGYGMVYAEAMARGLPIVASGAGAVPDTVPDAAGDVVAVGDRAALVAALRRIIADPAYRRGKADGSWAAGRALPRWEESATRFGRFLRSDS